MLHKGEVMKNLAILILSIGAMNLASFTNDESFFDQMNDVNLIEDNMCPINEDIKDDKLALEVWQDMSKLRDSLQDLLDEEERLAEQKRNIQRVDAQVKGVKW